MPAEGTLMGQLRTVEISGANALDRGRQYGEIAREPIRRSIEFYAESFCRTTGLTWDEVLGWTHAWVPLIEEYFPGILDEVTGIADGSGSRFEEILALNGRGELSNGNPFAGQNKEKLDEGCSSFAVLAEANAAGRVWAGQNWDWRSAVADTVVLLRIVQPDKPTIICQVEAGQVGRHGANSAGLALNANGLGGKFDAGLGVPGPYVRRRILESWDMNDALDALFKVRQAYATNLLLTHRDGFAIDVETTPGRHGWMYPTDGLLVHANHYIAFVPPELTTTYKPFSVDSLYRVPRIEAGLRRLRTDGTNSQLVRHIVRETMSDHFGFPNSVCNHPDPRSHELDRYTTAISSLVDLTTGEYFATSGVPCSNAYEQVPWNVYDGPGVDERTDLVAVPVPALATSGTASADCA
jgi:isopenicillin-N N-acyltransferase like protein